MTRRLFWVCTIILMSMSLLPFIFGWVMTPPQHTYTGLHGNAPGDILVYYSYLEQVRQGALAFRDLFTGEPQSANLILPVWLGTGLVGRLLHTPPPVTFHLVRVLSIPLLMAAIAAAARCFLTDKRQQRLAFLFAVFAGGLGFLLGPIEQHLWGRDVIEHFWPMDIWTSEGFTYLTAAQSPHFIVGTALLLFFLVETVHTLERGVRWRTVLAGVGACILLATTPFLIVLLIPLSLAALILSRSTGVMFHTRLTRLLCLWVPTLPALVYVGLYQAFDAFAKARATQNILMTPAWWVTLASYGLLIPLALWGVRQVWRDRSWRTRLLLAWFVVQPMLFFGPFFFQRRLVQGWQFPLGFLAAVGAEALLYRSRLVRWGGWKTGLVALALALLFGSPVYQLANDLALVSDEGRQELSAFYLPHTFMDGYAWVKKNTSPNAVVVADASYGVFLPAFSGRQTYVAHGVETLEYDRKRAVSRDVFRGVYSPNDVQRLAQREGWTYVWVSPVEKYFGFDLSRYPFLAPQFSNADVTIASVSSN